MFELIVATDHGRWVWRVESRDGRTCEDSPCTYARGSVAMEAGVKALQRWNEDAAFLANLRRRSRQLPR